MSEFYEQVRREAKERRDRREHFNLQTENMALRRKVAALEENKLDDDESSELFNRLEMLEQDMKKLQTQLKELQNIVLPKSRSVE